MKAVLILPEMPENCWDCQLCGDNYPCHGIANGNSIDYPLTNDVRKERQDWCPLRPMPEKVDEMLEDGSFMDGVYTGWNDAIRAIEGSGEYGA